MDDARPPSKGSDVLLLTRMARPRCSETFGGVSARRRRTAASSPAITDAPRWLGDACRAGHGEYKSASRRDLSSRPASGYNGIIARTSDDRRMLLDNGDPRRGSASHSTPASAASQVDYKSPTGMVSVLLGRGAHNEPTCSRHHGSIRCTGTPEDYKAVHAFDQMTRCPSSYGKPYTPAPGAVDPGVDMKLQSAIRSMRWTRTRPPTSNCSHSS